MNQLEEIAKTCARAFFGTLLAAVVASGLGFMEWDTWSEWKPVIAAAGVAAGIVVLNALNWQDDRYGIGASKE